MENILNSTRVSLTPSSLSLLLHACKAVLDPGASCSRVPAHHAGDGDADGIPAHHAAVSRGVVDEKYDILRRLC